MLCKGVICAYLRIIVYKFVKLFKYKRASAIKNYNEYLFLNI